MLQPAQAASAAGNNTCQQLHSENHRRQFRLRKRYCFKAFSSYAFPDGSADLEIFCSSLSCLSLALSCYFNKVMIRTLKSVINVHEFFKTALTAVHESKHFCHFLLSQIQCMKFNHKNFLDIQFHPITHIIHLLTAMCNQHLSDNPFSHPRSLSNAVHFHFNLEFELLLNFRFSFFS